MMKSNLKLKEIYDDESTQTAISDATHPPLPFPGPVPDYLQKHYWWAYVHPRAVRFWDRQWLINLILFGNFVRLRDAALSEFGQYAKGRTLQVACVYGDFTTKLAERIAPGGILDVVDILPIQIQNLRRKLPDETPVRLHYCNSNGLHFPDETFEQVIVFFVLHEQPPGVREKTVEEAVRVLKPGGKIIFVEYHRPVRWHPLHLVFLEPIVHKLEPFSPALWKHQIAEWLPRHRTPKEIKKQLYFGDLYQKVVVRY